MQATTYNLDSLYGGSFAADAPDTPEHETLVSLMVIGFSAIGILFALAMWRQVALVEVHCASEDRPRHPSLSASLLEEGRGEHDECSVKAAEIQQAIQEGARSFLATEYYYMGYFITGFSALLFCLLSGLNMGSKWIHDDKGVRRAPQLYLGLFSAISFATGAGCSVLCGYLGMMVATFANARVTLEARRSVDRAFATAFRAGSVMGFLLTSIALVVLFLLLCVYREIYGGDWIGLFEAITGYGLGGSTIALFGRVGGGIYTKAADVGADLVGKVEVGIPEDDPRNPAVIADNVGDNVGDIAGMGSDLFGSLAEGTCAALAIASLSSLGTTTNFTGICFPLLISAAGIVVCLLVTLLATEGSPVKKNADVEPAIKNQLILSTALMTPVLWFLAHWALPASFDGIHSTDMAKKVYPWQASPGDGGYFCYAFTCVAIGLWAGLLIGLFTEYYTSNRFTPVQEVADSCRTGAATNIIYGLALGYKSTLIPTIAIATAVFVGFSFADMFGIALAALGMLSTLATGLTIDAFGPISDNAGGIAEMAGMEREVRERTDALDSAGNTTAAIGKGFAIGSAALVSLSLFGAYVKRAEITLAQSSLLDPRIFSGLLIGAMIPYWFSSMTVKSVGKAALQMVAEVRRQFRTIAGIMEGTTRPDYAKCVEISTQASLAEMVAPGVLILGSPLIVGIFFGTQTVAGLLAGSLVSSVQLAVSMANSGGAWDNAKKYVEAGATEHARSLGGKGSDAHKAAVQGDTVGDPLKDTSGPSLNVVMKLQAVEALVLCPFFVKYTADGLLYRWLGL